MYVTLFKTNIQTGLPVNIIYEARCNKRIKIDFVYLSVVKIQLF